MKCLANNRSILLRGLLKLLKDSKLGQVYFYKHDKISHKDSENNEEQYSKELD